MQLGRLGFSLAVLPSTTGPVGGVWEAAMKLLSTSVLAAIVGFGMIAASAPSAQETMTKEKLLGPWQLVSFKATAGDKVSYPLGEHPGGYIEITPLGTGLWSLTPLEKLPVLLL